MGLQPHNANYAIKRNKNKMETKFTTRIQEPTNWCDTLKLLQSSNKPRNARVLKLIVDETPKVLEHMFIPGNINTISTYFY